jgi:AraC family transcriptional activator of mar-sox-rob regulon
MLWSTNIEVAESTPWHAHDLVEFILCRASGGRLAMEPEEIEFRADRTILVPPGVRHRYVVTPGAPARLKLVCLTRRDTATFLAPVQAALLGSLCADGVTAVDHDGSTDMLSKMIPDGIDIGDAAGQQVGFGVLGLLISLHGQARGTASNDPAWHRYRERICAVTNWIDAHLDAAVGLRELAARFGLSRTLLTREFRRHTGTSVIGYITSRRLEQAAMALVTGAGDVTAAAYASGFANLSHFHRCFKAAYGLTPATFRRKVVEEGGAIIPTRTKIDP